VSIRKQNEVAYEIIEFLNRTDILSFEGAAINFTRKDGAKCEFNYDGVRIVKSTVTDPDNVKPPVTRSAT